MTFREHITNIRTRRDLSQSELGKQVVTSRDIIGKYERNDVKPSIQVAVDITNALGVSLDYLCGISDLELDKDLLDKVTALQQLQEHDKLQIISTLDALLRDVKTRQAYS